MTDLQMVNLDHLRVEYFENVPGARQAAALLLEAAAGRSKRDLFVLLRHHDEGTISDGDTRVRDGFDYLLGFFSLLEVAAISGYLPAEFPRDTRVWLLELLENLPLRIYAEENYPLALPLMLRRRLEGIPVLPAGNGIDGESFPLFLDISLPIERDPDLEVFLWFLDGGERYDAPSDRMVDIDDTIRLLGSQKQFVGAMGARGKERGQLATSVTGFAKFLDFARAFDQLLRLGTKRTAERAAFWHYHGYWFSLLSDRLAKQLDRAIDRFARWESPNVRDEMPAAVGRLPRRKMNGDLLRRQSYETDRLDLKRAVSRLVSGRYGTAITSALSPGFARKVGPNFP